MELDTVLFTRIKKELEGNAADVRFTATVTDDKVDWTIQARWDTGREWEIVGIEETSS